MKSQATVGTAARSDLSDSDLQLAAGLRSALSAATATATATAAATTADPGTKSGRTAGTKSGRTAGTYRSEIDVSVAAFDRVVAAVDASHFLFNPSAVIRAASIQQVAATFRYAQQNGRHITLRSGGTSLSGQASGDDLLVDTRAAFRSIRTSDDGATVMVEPGATVRQVNSRLLRYGRKLGPDPASEIAATIGGVVANNSSGMACGTVHNSYRTIRSMRFVLPSGTIVNTSRPDADEQLARREPALYRGLAEIRAQLLADPALQKEVTRQYTGKNTMGYGLNSFLDFETPVEILAHLMVGSEGSLGFIAEVEFETIPIAPHAATALVVFEDLERATRILPVLVATGAATIELMDAGSLRVVQGDPTAAGIVDDITIDRHAALLIEYHDNDDAGLERKLSKAESALTAAGAPSFRPTRDPRERTQLWHVRKGLYASVAGARPSGTTALLEDIAVPVAELAPTCRALQALFADYSYQNPVIFGHAKDGNIHFLITEDFTQDGAIERQRTFTEDLVELVLRAGGTLKAEHGTGRIMAPFVERQFGKQLYRFMLRVKQLCDPTGILNPGVLIGSDAEAHLTQLKLTPKVEPEVDRCVECGYCEPVCPSKDLTLTPRQRIAVRRARTAARTAGNAALDAELAKAEDYQSLQTCAVDGMCQTACPVLINTGDLVRRLREQDAPKVTKAAGHAAAKQWAPISRGAASVLTAAKVLPAPLVRGASEAARMVVSKDLLPRWSEDLPRGGSSRRPKKGEHDAGKGADVVFFAACVGSMFGPADGGIGAAEAFRTLCDRAGLTLTTPPNLEDLCCGTPWKSKGLTDGFTDMAQRTVRSLVEASDGGRLPIVSDNSSCTEGLLHALEKVDALKVGGLEGTTPALTIIDSVDFAVTELLPRLSVGEPLESLALHPTCSSTRLGSNQALKALADTVARTATVPDDWGCCAFAGDRGMLHPELTASATKPEAAEIAAGGFDAHASCNRTCEIGMSRATGENYRHILEILEERTRPGGRASYELAQ